MTFCRSGLSLNLMLCVVAGICAVQSKGSNTHSPPTGLQLDLQDKHVGRGKQAASRPEEQRSLAGSGWGVITLVQRWDTRCYLNLKQLWTTLRWFHRNRWTSFFENLTFIMWSEFNLELMTETMWALHSSHSCLSPLWANLFDSSALADKRGVAINILIHLSMLFIPLNIHRWGAVAWCVRKVCSCGKTARVAKSLTSLIPAFHLSLRLSLPFSGLCTCLVSQWSHREGLLYLSFGNLIMIIYI